MPGKRWVCRENMNALRLRPQVAAFAQAMEARLRQNDHKGTWLGLQPRGLVAGVRDCANRLTTEIHEPGGRVIEIAADAANYAMFTADVCGQLDRALVVDTKGQPDASALRDAGNRLVDACHGASMTAGWWRDPKTGTDYREEVRSGSRFGKALVAEKLCLTHSEISEGMEGHRKSLPDDKLPHRSMLEVELADAVIRIADLAGALGLDLGGAIAEKMAFNAHRPDHKPEARAAEGGKSY